MGYCKNCEHCKQKEKLTKRRPFKHPVVDGYKICADCKDKKQVILFNKRPNGNLKAHCKDCQKIRNANYYYSKR